MRIAIVGSGGVGGYLGGRLAAGGQDEQWLTETQLSGNPVRVPAATYARWFAGLDPALREEMIDKWGPPPGEVFARSTIDWRTSLRPTSRAMTSRMSRAMSGSVPSAMKGWMSLRVPIKFWLIVGGRIASMEVMKSVRRPVSAVTAATP